MDVRDYPEADDRYGQAALTEVKAADWMIELLKLNPEYTSWGPGEDAMQSTVGWQESLIFSSWNDFHGPDPEDATGETITWELDYLNECVNFYFKVDRPQVDCPKCSPEGDEQCPCCKGVGYIYTEFKAHVNLVLWMLHPRKSCSRGIEVKNIGQADLPEVFKYLRGAAERNTNRFSKVSK
jgi:hypothetical protein